MCPTPSITTLPGLVSSAKRRPTACRRFLALFAPVATQALSLCWTRPPRVSRFPAGRWTTRFVKASPKQDMANILFIAPDIYLEEFGVRSEVNMLVRSNHAEVTGKIQTELVII